MWRGLVVLTACGFQGPPTLVAGDGPLPPPGQDGRAAGAPDAAPPPAIDAPPPCTMKPGETRTLAGHIGGSGGTAQTAITCMGDGVPVGLQLDITQAALANHANQLAVVAVHVRCGTITGTTTALGELVTRVGEITGTCTGYDAPIASTELVCPQGAAISAIDANMPDTTLYNSVVITCSDGSALPFPTSGAYTTNPQHVACAAGTVVASFDDRAGCGQDQLALECAALTCD